jgi:hypothetical protein
MGITEGPEAGGIGVTEWIRIARLQREKLPVLEYRLVRRSHGGGRC